MSILIKGMEMPRKCIRCPVNVYGTCLVNDDKDVSKAAADAVRDKDCPIDPIQPHGRLIDADKAAERVWELMRFPSNLANAQWFENTLREMPTIIHAEEGE